jgi:predicted phage terminase large subunit-like protein
MELTNQHPLYHIPLHRRGPALWPEVLTEALLKTMRKLLGSVAFEKIYQGDPAPESGAVFQAGWFGTYATHPHLVEVGQAWDTALKDGDGHDYSVGLTAGRDTDGAIYLLDCWRGQVIVPELARVMTAQHARWRPRWVLVEDAGAGTVLLQTLRRDCGIPLIGVKPKDGKRTRALGITPQVEGGRVRLPAVAPWREAFLDELCTFPHGRHDDQVDAFVYLISRFVERATPPLPGQKPVGW